MPVLQEGCRLQCDCHLVAQKPGLAFDNVRRARGGDAQVTLQLCCDGIEAGIRAAAGVQLAEEGIDRSRLSSKRAQNVKAYHVAAAFPDGVQRRLPV